VHVNVLIFLHRTVYVFVSVESRYQCDYVLCVTVPYCSSLRYTDYENSWEWTRNESTRFSADKEPNLTVGTEYSFVPFQLMWRPRGTEWPSFWCRRPATLRRVPENIWSWPDAHNYGQQCAFRAKIRVIGYFSGSHITQPISASGRGGMAEHIMIH
jgi:hypothetical protein